VSGSAIPAWRRILAGCTLALLAAFEVRVLRMDDVSRRLRRIAQQIHGEDVPRSLTTGFYFDPGYADFLTEIARRTPRDATVAVLVPTRPDLYRYQAVYLLAPRRVVASEIPEAGYVAIYGRRWESGNAGQPLPNGTLLSR
jgi:hypothetical protein